MFTGYRFHGSIGSTRFGVGDSLIISFPGVEAGCDGRGAGVGLGVGWEGWLGLSESRFMSILRDKEFVCWQFGVNFSLATG